MREHLETGWEPTLALLEQAMGEGVIRRVSLPVLQRMISASIEDFLADRTLDAQGISYTDALDEMISIFWRGCWYDEIQSLQSLGIYRAMERCLLSG